ncbi:phage tailspike protein [Escherichia coli]
MTNITPNVVIGMPSQLFTMARSFKAVANGKIYIGKIDTDPVNTDNQIQVYVENEDGSHVPVAQPIIINAAGYPVYNGQIAKFVTVQGHSMAVYDAYGAKQFYFPNVLKYDPDQLRDEFYEFKDEIIGINGILNDGKVRAQTFGFHPENDAENNTNALISAFAQSGKGTITEIIVDLPGVYLINGPITIPNNTKLNIFTGVEIRNSDNRNMTVFKSQYWDATIANPSVLTNKSDFLEISGGGFVNYNGNGSVPAPGGMNSHALCIAGVKHLKLGIKVGGALKYAILAANIDFVDVPEGIIFDNNSDGLHLQPPIKNAYIRNLSGRTGDDMFAMTGGDYSSYDVGTRGSFDNIDVYGIYGENSLTAIKITGNTNTPFNQLKFGGIYGTYTLAVVSIIADDQLTGTVVRNIDVNGLHGVVASGMHSFLVSDNSKGTVQINKLRVTDVGEINRNNTGGNLYYFRGNSASGNGINCQDVDIEIPRNVGACVKIGNIGYSGQTIQTLKVSCKNTILNGNKIVDVSAGEIKRLIVDGTVEGTNNDILVNQNGGVINNLTFNTPYIKILKTFNNAVANNDSSAVTVNYNGTEFRETSFIATFSGDAFVDFSGCRISGSGVAGNIMSSSGVITVSGSLLGSGGVMFPSPASGVKYRCMSQQIACNYKTLDTSFDGQQCWNMDNSTVLAVGPCVRIAGKWYNIALNTSI